MQRLTQSLQSSFQFIFLTLCFGEMVKYLVESIMTIYKVNLTNEQIYIYYMEINKKIKEKLDMIFERKIYMLVFSIFLILFVIAQYTLIIIDNQLFKKKIMVIIILNLKLLLIKNQRENQIIKLMEMKIFKFILDKIFLTLKKFL